jgi:predicted NAD/FAD-binding protein
MRIAIIGTGIAGNAAAWALSRRYPVTVYERELRPGGHSHTVTVDYDGTPVAVDTGFIVYNEVNYPGFTALLDHLGVETVESCMSFAVTADNGRFEWKGGGDTWPETAKGLFAQPSNLLSPSYLWMLRDILTFNDASVKDHADGTLSGLSLGTYFRMRGFAPRLLTDYLAPMAAAIWSAPRAAFSNFPPRTSSRSSAITACCNTIVRNGARSKAAAGSMSTGSRRPSAIVCVSAAP